MNENPYATPRTQPNQPPKSLRLFTPLAIGVHALLMPWFALVFAIVNSVRLRRRGDVPLYGGLLVSLIAGTIVASGIHKTAISLTIRIVGVLLGFAVCWHQAGVIRPRLATDAKPARWYLWWLGLLPVLFMFLVVWQFLEPIPRR